LAVSLITAAALFACGESTATNTGNPGTDDPSLPDGIELVRSSLERDTSPDVPVAELAAFGDSSRSFALDLYAEVKAGEGNLFISPYSIATAFGMLYAGTKGETKSELMSALHFDLPEPELHAAFNATDLALSGRAKELAGENQGGEKSTGDGLQLNVVNAAFGRKGADFQEPYLDVLAEHYDTGMFATDFNQSEVARKAINDWVLEQTKDRIEDLLPEGSIFPDVVMVLVNAIYFKGSWLEPFDPAKTTKAQFHAPGGDVEVDMMNANIEMPYAEGDGYQALALPYISPSVRMLFVLPEAGRFEEIEAGLDRAFVDSVRGALGEHLVAMQVPKFRYEAELKLKPLLQQMGVEAVFEEGVADLSGIIGSPGEVWVDEAYHKAFVALDEQGTEAAAATAIVARDESAPQPAAITLDRPFLFMIYDQPTGQILFLGRVLDPNPG
jgi:serpin B